MSENERSHFVAESCTIVSSRIIAAPRAVVFRAFTDPDHLRHWWGPKGFTNTFEEFDPRPGGVWRFIMHGPDGVNYQNQSVFIEVVEPERIVLHHVSSPRFHMHMTFEAETGQTRLTWRMAFETPEMCARLRPICEPGNEQNFDRLEARLAGLTTKSPAQRRA